jgi:hypothetical protein
MEQWAQALGPLLVDIYNNYLRCRLKVRSLDDVFIDLLDLGADLQRAGQDRRVLVLEPLVGTQVFREALGYVLLELLRVSSHSPHALARGAPQRHSTTGARHPDNPVSSRGSVYYGRGWRGRD